MKVLLAALPSEPGRPDENLAGLGRVLHEASGRADLVVVAEAFGQSFEALTDDPDRDRAIAWTVDGTELARVRAWAAEAGVAVCLGFLERDGSALHSSALVVDGEGRDVCLYRRISKGWRAPDADPQVYIDGTDVAPFVLAGKRCVVALCGDLWDAPYRFAAAQPDVLLWPLFVNYEIERWEAGERDAYAEQVADVAEHVLAVNAVVRASEIAPEWGGPAHGGAAWFSRGAVRAELPMGDPGTLLVDLG